MAIEGGSSGGFRKRKSGSFGGGTPRFLVWILRIVLGIIFILCLFGFINQVATGQKITDWFIQTGTRFGDTIVYIFKGDEDSPVEVTDQGVYADGYAPDGSKKLTGDTDSSSSTTADSSSGSSDSSSSK